MSVVTVAVLEKLFYCMNWYEKLFLYGDCVRVYEL